MDAETRRRERQRQLAQALMGAQTPQGQMVGRFYVPPSPLQNIAALGSQFVGGRLNRRLDEQEAAAEKKQREENQRLARALTGAVEPGSMENPQQAAAMQAFGGLPLDTQQQVLGGQAQARMFPGPAKLRDIDLGDRIQQVDEQGRVVNEFQKGNTPDALMRERGAMERFAGVSGSTRLGAETSRRGQDLSAQTALRGQDLADVRGTADRESREQIAAAAREGKQGGDVAQAWNTYQTARNGLMNALENTTTGPIAGQMPAFTAAQQTAEGGVSAMAPVLKQLFRVAGEGTFTDRDQALLLAMVPTRTDRPGAAAAKIANIDAIVRAKLGLPALEVETPEEPEEPENPGLDAVMRKYGVGP